ncbi:MAG TPA: glycosyltransferase family 39 protein [Bacteroidia bacterium]
MGLTENISKQTKYLIYLLLAVVLYFVFFHRLSSFYMRTWDESLYAVNTYEMLQRNEFIAPYFDGAPDNDKPPMFFWHQMVSIKLFGYNEFGARFPSALYGALTVLMLFVFIKKHFGILLSFIIALVLCCAKGFVTFHSARTGEMDTMIAFAILGMSISFFNYLETGKLKHLFLYFFFLVFGFYTKILVALVILPVHALYILFKRRDIMKDTRVWLGLLVSFGLIALFLYIRNGYGDQYVQKHILCLFNRYGQTPLQDHDQPFDFYLNNLFNERFVIFAILIIPAVYLLTKEENRSLKLFLQLTTLSTVFFLLFISVSVSKLYWYDVPLYPLLAVLAGYVIWRLTMVFSARSGSALTFTTLFFIIPVYYAIKRSHNNNITDVEARKCEVIPEYFHDRKNSMPYDKISVADNNFRSPVLFYKHLFEQYNKEINITNANLLKANEVVIAGNDSIKKYITEHYQTEQLETYKNAIIFKIKG